MDKLSQLLNIINCYSNDAHWNYRLIKFAEESASLISKSEDFDIKDEELFNQFESFMSAYKDLVNILEIDANNLNEESLEDAGQLIETLNKRYQRLVNNTYLNVNESEGYDEDFDPGDFTNFIESVAVDAENKLKAIAGEDIDISEMRAAQYANEFNNNKNIDRGDKNITWTGDKVTQNLEARKRWFQNILMLKKININDPRVQNYIAARKRQYQNIMADPDRKAAYNEKGRARNRKKISKLQKEYINKRKGLKTLIEHAKKMGDIDGVRKLTLELNSIEHKKLSQEKELARKIKQKKESGSLEGLNIKLQQRIATQKMEIKKYVAEKMAKSRDTIFKPYLDELASARANNNQTALLSVSQQLRKAMGEYAETQPEVTTYIEKSQDFIDFRNKINTVIKSNWLESENIDPEVKPHLINIINDGKNLVSRYDGIQFFNPLINSVKEIVSNLEVKI